MSRFSISNPDARLLKALRFYCNAAAICAVVTGCLVLCGWAFHIEFLKSGVPGTVSVKANTALGLLLAGISLWLLLPLEAGIRRRRAGRFLAWFVALIGAMTRS